MTIVMAQQGWQCPNCGNIISPNMMWCPFCSGEKKVTYTTTTSTPYKVDISSVCKTEPQTNADQHAQHIGSVESVGNNDDIIVRSNLEPFRVDEPKDEPQVVMPKKCKGCDSTSKIIEAYSRGFEDGAEAVKAMPQTERSK